MITLTIFVIALLIIAIVLAFTLLAGGAAFLVTFGDVIIAVFIIAMIVKHFLKKKKGN